MGAPRRHHLVLAAGIGAMGLELLPPEGERLWTLNAVCVPDGVDEAAVRRDLLDSFNSRSARGSVRSPGASGASA